MGDDVGEQVTTDIGATGPTGGRRRGAGRVALAVLLGVLGSWAGVRVTGHVDVTTDVGVVTVTARPSYKGITRLSVAPLGSVVADSHRSPLMLDARLEALDDDVVLRQAESFQNDGKLDTAVDTSAIADDLRGAAVPLALRTVAGAVLGGALLALLVLRSWRLTLLAGAVGLVGSAASLALTAATVDETAWKDPELKGLVAIAPELVTQVNSSDNTEASDYFARTVRNLQGIYRGYVGTARTLQELEGTQRVAAIRLTAVPVRSEDAEDDTTDVVTAVEDPDATGETTTTAAGDTTTTSSTTTTVPPSDGAVTVDPGVLRTFASLTTDQKVVAAVLYLDAPAATVTRAMLTEAGFDAGVVVVGTDRAVALTPAKVSPGITVRETVPGRAWQVAGLQVVVAGAGGAVPASTSIVVLPPGAAAPEERQHTTLRVGRTLRAAGARRPEVVLPRSTSTNLEAAVMAISTTTGVTPLVNLLTVEAETVNVRTVTP